MDGPREAQTGTRIELSVGQEMVRRRLGKRTGKRQEAGYDGIHFAFGQSHGFKNKHEHSFWQEMTAYL